MAVTSKKLIEIVRSELVSGQWQADMRLPVREEMIKQFNSSQATVQKAMSKLASDGFIVSQGKKGTFTSTRPPHLYTVGVVLPVRKNEQADWDVLWNLLLNQKRYYEKELNRRLKFYYLDDSFLEHDDFKKLLYDAQNYLISGLLFLMRPAIGYIDKLLFYDLPIVEVTNEISHEKISTVWFDYDALFDNALDYLQSAGCTRVAMLTNTRLPMRHVDHFETALRERGLPADKSLVQAVGIDKYSRAWVERLVELILTNCGNRPDGLVVANQNLLKYVLAELHRLDLKPGKDIFLVSHCNLPNAELLPAVKYIGFDQGKTIKLCVETLDKVRKTGVATHDGLSAAECISNDLV